MIEARPQQRALGAVTVMDARANNVYREQEAKCVGDDEPLAALDLLPVSKPLVETGTVSAVRTDCEWMSPHWVRRCGRPRHRPGRAASWSRSTVPSSSHHVKYHYTLGQGAKSLGS